MNFAIQKPLLLRNRGFWIAKFTPNSLFFSDLMQKQLVERDITNIIRVEVPGVGSIINPEMLPRRRVQDPAVLRDYIPN